MKTCSECKGLMKEATAKTSEGIRYTYFKCEKCGEEILNMKQLHAVAAKYRRLKTYHVKLSRWGLSLGMRIPKEVATFYHFKDNEHVVLVPEEEGLRLIPCE